MQFKLDQLHSSNNISGEHQPMLTKTNWVAQFASQFDSKDFKSSRLETQSGQQITHAGLIYYFHQCWAQEIGACLRPDMFWYTIVSELANEILDNPVKYKHLFSDQDKKTDIIILTDDITDLDVETLIDQMKNIIANKEFLNIICNTRFDSEVPNSNLAILMTFACMATPYFNYMTTRCGIPHLQIEGTQEEWEKLYNSCKDLEKVGLNSNKCNDYIKRVTNLIANIIFHCFGKRTLDMKPITENTEEFFNNVFHYGKNTRCGSGHDDVIVQGWIRDLYFKNYDYDLHKFNTHINYVPYRNIETKRMFCKVTGLTYSDHDKDTNTLHAQYGFIKYEVLNNKVFNYLSKQ